MTDTKEPDMPEIPTTYFEVGEVFDFASVYHRPPNVHTVDQRAKIIGVTVLGEVEVSISRYTDGPFIGYFKMPYDLVCSLIRDGLWVPVD